jgi:hypothetical protein
MSAVQAAGQTIAAATPTASLVSKSLISSTLSMNSTAGSNETLSLPLRALRYTLRAERLLLRKAPVLLLRLTGLPTLAHLISDALGMSAPFAGGAGAAVPEAATEAAGPQTWTVALMEALELGNIRSLGGMFNFLFSRWAFACLAMVPLPPPSTKVQWDMLISISGTDTESGQCICIF